MNIKKKIAKKAGECGVVAASGASVGAAVYGVIGGMGLAVGGTAVGITLGPLMAIGGGLGLAGYGLYKLGKIGSGNEGSG